MEREGDANLRRESSCKSSCTHFRRFTTQRTGAILEELRLAEHGGEGERASRFGFEVGEVKE